MFKRFAVILAAVLIGLFAIQSVEAKRPAHKPGKKLKKWQHFNRAAWHMTAARAALKKRQFRKYNRHVHYARYHLARATIRLRRRGKPGKPGTGLRYKYKVLAKKRLDKNQKIVKKHPRVRKAPSFKNYLKFQKSGRGFYNAKKYGLALFQARKAYMVLHRILINRRKKIAKALALTQAEEKAVPANEAEAKKADEAPAEAGADEAPADGEEIGSEGDTAGDEADAGAPAPDEMGVTVQ